MVAVWPITAEENGESRGDLYVAGEKLDDDEGVTYYISTDDGGITQEGASTSNYIVSYDSENKILTLNNAKLFKTYWQGDQEDAEEVIICGIGNLEIRLKGQNHLTFTDNNQETKSMPSLSQFGDYGCRQS